MVPRLMHRSFPPLREAFFLLLSGLMATSVYAGAPRRPNIIIFILASAQPGRVARLKPLLARGQERDEDGVVPRETGGRPSVRIRGRKTTWDPVTLDITGPRVRESSEPNPFLDYRLKVTFSNGEASYEVEGYFAADGDAANSGGTEGDVWRVHFVPDRSGVWKYRVSFRTGKKIAIGEGEEASTPVRSGRKGGRKGGWKGDGLEGTFDVAADEGARGLLRYVGERYLRFAGSGEYFIKGGADSPENFLAYGEFDGEATEPAGQGRPREGEARRASHHLYTPHVRDWKPGDPTWRGGRGKGIIGALDYLASKGVNSLYFLTMNIQGDGDDVWPYRRKDERLRFDCSKLDQWEVVFTHMDRLGMMMHVVLTETENESLFENEEGGLFAERRKLYYRELIARFGHHRAIVWNIGEENGWDDRKKKSTGAAGRANTHDQRKAFAGYIRRTDPYDRPIVVHTLPGRYDEIYRPLLGHPAFEGPSLQVQLGPRIHEETARWVDRSAKAGRQWVVTLDEIGPAGVGVKPDADDPEHEEVRRYALWGTLMAGGAGCEWYFGYRFAHNDLGLEDFRSRERMWEQTAHAIEFFQSHLPFTKMHHADELVTGKEVYCLAWPGHVYAVYIPGGVTTSVWLPDAMYRVAWYDPRRGGELRSGSQDAVRGGGHRSPGQPPSVPERDWVVLLKLEGEPPATIPEPPVKEKPPADGARR